MIATPKGKLRSAVFLFIQTNPGPTSHDVCKGFPNEKPLSIGATLSHLYRDGFLSRQKKGAMFHYFIAEPVAEPVAAPLSDRWSVRDDERMKIDAETKLRAAEAELFGANARIHHLEQWRNAAIARYPDLDVDPALLAKARQIVMRASDITTALADDILAGEWDHTPIVRATLEALKSSVL